MKEYVLKIKHPKAYYTFYRFLQFLLQAFFKMLYRVEEKGRGNIPKKGGFILCSNHIAYIDPIIIAVFFPRCIFFMAKVEIFDNRFVASLAKFFNAFPVNRNTYDRKTLRNSIDILNAGEVVGIFPQGTRFPDGTIGEGKKGIGMLSVMGRHPIIPMAISGTNKILKKPYKRIFFPKIRILYGDVIDTAMIKEKHGSREAVKIIVENTMASIRDLYQKINK